MDKRSYFGVKSINGFYDVKEIRLPEDVSRVSEFDFILEDTQNATRHTNSTGYTSGRFEVMTEFNMPAIFGEWKLTGISVYGRWPKLCMTDKFGESIVYEREGFGQVDYDENKPRYIHDILVEVLKFSKKYLFTKHSKFFSNLKYNLPKVSDRRPYELPTILKTITSCTNDYEELISLLKKENASQETTNQLKFEYNNAISKYFNFKIIID